MAYRGRGGGGRSSGRRGGGIRVGRYHHHYYRYYRTSAVAEFAGILIAAIFIAVSYFISYKPVIVDPIKTVKDIYINSYLIIMGIIVVVNISFIIAYWENKKELFYKILTVFALSILIISVFLLLKIGMDSYYTKEKFEQLYAKSGETVISEKFYINDCEQLYTRFSMKALALLVLNGLLILLILYQLFKLAKIKKGLDRLEKDDIVVYDEEQNIKI